MRHYYIQERDYKVGDRVRVIYSGSLFGLTGTVINMIQRIGRVAPLVEFDNGETHSFAYSTSKKR